MSERKHARRRNRRRFRRHAHPPGTIAAPGTIAVDPHAKPPVVRVITYGPTEFHEERIDDLSRLHDHVGRLPVTWVNVDGLGDAETLHRLGEMFHLHPLALEDVVHSHQRAKVEEYGEHLFIVARMVSVHSYLESEQISFFLGPKFVLSFQENIEGDSLDPVRNALRKGLGRLRQSGPDYLLYALLDAVIDGYFPVMEHYGDRLDALDETLSGAQADWQAVREIHHIRSELLQLRRAIWPHRDAVNALLRTGSVLISHDTTLYLRDCYDHTIQIIDVLEVYRESCSDLRDYFYTLIGNRTNETMRTLTIIATIFMPLSFITGIYGMNFDNFPELHWKHGYPFALSLMALVTLGLLFLFWKRGWLTPPEEIKHPNNGAPRD